MPYVLYGIRFIRYIHTVYTYAFAPHTHEACARCDALAVCLHTNDGDGFWTNLERVIELGQPLSDAIHQLEAGRPRLSKLLPIWNDLIKHADAFDAKHGLQGDKRVAPVFRRRFAIHYQPEWLAAYALDPAHATKGDGGRWRLPLALRDTPLPTARNGAQLEFNHYFGAAKDGTRVVADDDVLTCVAQLARAERAAVAAELNKLKLRGVTGDLADLVELVAGNGTAPLDDKCGWWCNAADAGFPLLAKAATKLLSCHPTSCASERNWSLWGNVCTKARNRLALERAKKLVFIRYNHGVSVTRESGDDVEIMLTLLSDE